MSTARYEPEVRARMRVALMKKGREIATLLAEVLAGGDGGSSLRALMATAKPGEKPEEKLRRYLDLIERKRRLLDAEDDHFGGCEACGMDLGAMALQEMPWADRCPRHAL